MKKTGNDWSTMLTGANGRVSSKRVLGCFILIVLLVTIVVSVFRDVQAVWLGEAIITMMIGAFALLGIGVFEKRFKTPIPGDQTEQETVSTDVDEIDEADRCA